MIYLLNRIVKGTVSRHGPLLVLKTLIKALMIRLKQISEIFRILEDICEISVSSMWLLITKLSL